MRRRDTLQALSEDLDIPEAEVPRTILKQILLNLKVRNLAALVDQRSEMTGRDCTMLA